MRIISTKFKLQLNANIIKIETKLCSKIETIISMVNPILIVCAIIIDKLNFHKVLLSRAIQAKVAVLEIINQSQHACIIAPWHAGKH